MEVARAHTGRCSGCSPIHAAGAYQQRTMHGYKLLVLTPKMLPAAYSAMSQGRGSRLAALAK